MSLLKVLRSKLIKPVSCKDEDERARIEAILKNPFKKPLFYLSNNLGLLALTFAGTIAVGTMGLMFVEGGYSLLESLYWAVVTGFTVGFGDISPITPPGLWMAIWYIPTMSILYALLVSYLISEFTVNYDRDSHREQELRDLATDTADAKAQLAIEIMTGHFLATQSQQVVNSRIQEIIKENRATRCNAILAEEAELEASTP